jgi:hypothetical protein
MIKKLITIIIIGLLLVSCQIKVYNGIIVISNSLFGMGDTITFGVKGTIGHDGWYTLQMDGSSSDTGVLQVDDKIKKVNIGVIEKDSFGNYKSIIIDNIKYYSK